MSHDKLRILVAESLGEDGLLILNSQPGFLIEEKTSLSRAELLKYIPDIHCLLVRSQTKVDKELLSLATNLRLIGRAGVGLDNIDISSAEEKGIAVINTPSGNSISTAELSIALMLSLARQIPTAHALTSEGSWERKRFMGIELYQKTLGLVGFGNVARLVAERAKAFGMHVIAFDPFLDASQILEHGVSKVSEPELFAHSDFISLHCALNEHNKGFINQKSLKLMKQSAYVINTARGELIDSEALCQALDQKLIAGAAIDVYPVEPPPKNDLLINHNKIINTPHLGASTEEGQRRVAKLLAEKTISFFLGKRETN
jgi:D-3-phosphoglycerate dehydrogenase